MLRDVSLSLLVVVSAPFLPEVSEDWPVLLCESRLQVAEPIALLFHQEHKERPRQLTYGWWRFLEKVIKYCKSVPEKGILKPLYLHSVITHNYKHVLDLQISCSNISMSNKNTDICQCIKTFSQHKSLVTVWCYMQHIFYSKLTEGLRSPGSFLH